MNAASARWDFTDYISSPFEVMRMLQECFTEGEDKNSAA